MPEITVPLYTEKAFRILESALNQESDELWYKQKKSSSAKCKNISSISRKDDGSIRMLVKEDASVKGWDAKAFLAHLVKKHFFICIGGTDIDMNKTAKKDRPDITDAVVEFKYRRNENESIVVKANEMFLLFEFLSGKDEKSLREAYGEDAMKEIVGAPRNQFVVTQREIVRAEFSKKIEALQVKRRELETQIQTINGEIETARRELAETLSKIC